MRSSPDTSLHRCIRHPVLVFPRLSEEETNALSQGYEITIRVDGVGLDDLDTAYLSDLRCVLTTGPVGLPAGMLAHFPALEAIISFGAGYDRIDLDGARRRDTVNTIGDGLRDAIDPRLARRG